VLLLEFLQDNIALVLTLVAFVAALVLRGKRRAWFEWANETAFLAFDNAEKKGLIEGLPGSEKLRHYMNLWRSEYVKRFGEEPDEKTLKFAEKKAAELAVKEKQIRANVEAFSDPN
jgi:hypothetical protein